MTAVDRSAEFWTPEPIFKGETVFVLASGPSLTRETADKVRGRRCIVVNASTVLAPFADVWFFTDNGVCDRQRDTIESWLGLIVTLSRRAKREWPDRVRRVKGETSAGFPNHGSPTIRQGRSSGHTAISLAIALGAARVPMLGFDMRVVDGCEHHHKGYGDRPRDLDIYAREFVPAFEGWRDAARAVGCEIVNCTPGSAVTEFPFVDMDEVLTCARS